MMVNYFSSYPLVFICFVEMSPLFEIPCKVEVSTGQCDYSYNYKLTENQSVAFLTQRKDKIYLNILQFDDFNKGYYNLYTTKTFLKRSDSKLCISLTFSSKIRINSESGSYASLDQ